MRRGFGRWARAVTAAALCLGVFGAAGEAAPPPRQARRAAAPRLSLAPYRQSLAKIVAQTKAGEEDYAAMQAFSRQLSALPVESIDDLFHESLKKYPEFPNELKIGWAWALADKGLCSRALSIVSETGPVAQDFWGQAKRGVLLHCTSSSHGGGAGGE